MSLHHPADALLIALAAGALARGPAVVVSAHAERCPRCAARLHELEAVCGALLHEIESAVLAPDALSRTLARIDALGVQVAVRPPTAARPPRGLRATLPAGVGWPRSLAGSTTTGWLWLAPGVRWSRVTLDSAEDANVYLLRVAAGKSLPVHSHRGGELTHVLYGAFLDGNERFAPGDLEEADDSVHHRPIVAAGGECICLISVEGRLVFDGPIARVLGWMLGL